MASKQWAGEVISSRDKTTVSEEFADLEKDIELRREGATKLLAASGTYQHVLSKKKKTDGFADADNLLPIDTLGIAMILHGEEFGDDSAFGTSLVKLGRAHCKVAALQEGYALTFKDTFIASVEKFLEDIKEYDAERKKLDSRRLTYDAAFTKFEKLKNGKKEKEKKEAEDELEKAKERYEETSEEVQAQMHSIQDNEIVQLRELTSFLDLEINFVEQYLSVLKDVKSDWQTESIHKPDLASRTPNRLAHNFSRSDSALSRRSGKSTTKHGSDSSDEEVRSRSDSRSRRSSLSKRRNSSSSKLPSRASSDTASRKRADSVTTSGDKSDKEKDTIKESDKDKDRNRRLSVAGWASSAVDTVTGRSKKVKDKDKFATLTGEPAREGEIRDEEQNSTVKAKTLQSLSRKLSRDKSLKSPKMQGKILRPPALQDKKIATALHNFHGGSDELSFEVGDVIVVINEVLDGWWMGELEGKKGLFPTTHVEVSTVKAPTSRKTAGRNGYMSSSPYEDDLTRSLADGDSSHFSSDGEDDHDLARQPLSHNNLPGQFYGGLATDTISIDSTRTEDDYIKPSSRSLPLVTNFTRTDADEDLHFSVSEKSSPRSKIRPPVPVRPAAFSANSDISSPPRKAPPPPPPRRATVTSLQTPPVPARPRRITPASSVSSHEHNQSPFESVADLQTGKMCREFKQNPFQAKGMCNNCFQFHG